jgi:hypothetical protein
VSGGDTTLPLMFNKRNACSNKWAESLSNWLSGHAHQ